MISPVGVSQTCELDFKAFLQFKTRFESENKTRPLKFKTLHKIYAECSTQQLAASLDEQLSSQLCFDGATLRQPTRQRSSSRLSSPMRCFAMDFERFRMAQFCSALSLVHLFVVRSRPGQLGRPVGRHGCSRKPRTSYRAIEARYHRSHRVCRTEQEVVWWVLPGVP